MPGPRGGWRRSGLRLPNLWSDSRFESRGRWNEVTIAGDWAIVWGEYQVELTPRQGGESAGESATERGKYLDVLRKEDGEWKFARSVWNTSEP